MAIKSDYISGTITLTNGSANFSGTGTGWQSAAFKEGDTIIDITGATEYMGVVEEITGETTGVLTKPWEGPNLSGVAYRLRYQPDGARSTAQARNLIEILGNGNITAFASLNGSANSLPMFTGPGAMTLVTRQDLVSGASYDVQVANLAARAAYDAQDTGFAVLVSDIGDGRAALYSKNSATSGDWSSPAYITGPVGPAPVVEAEVTVLPSDGTASVEVTPITGGYNLDFSLPAAPGFYFEGPWNNATNYVIGDVVRNNGSSWIAIRNNTNVSPPVLPTTSNADWELLAQRGTDGLGTGDVNGPASSTNLRIAVFSGTSGKQLADGGYTIAQLIPTATQTWTALTGNTQTLTDLKWLSKGIGEIIAMPNIAGEDEPPRNSSLYRYAKLTYQDAYNQDPSNASINIFSAQTSTDPFPLTSSEGTIGLTGSPLIGKKIRLINTERRFLRAGLGGTVQNDAMQNHRHWAYENGGGQFWLNRYPVQTSYDLTSGPSGYAEPNIDKTGYIHGDNSARLDSNETRVKNLGVTYYMRIK